MPNMYRDAALKSSSLGVVHCRAFPQCRYGALKVSEGKAAKNSYTEFTIKANMKVRHVKKPSKRIGEIREDSLKVFQSFSLSVQFWIFAVVQPESLCSSRSLWQESSSGFLRCRRRASHLPMFPFHTFSTLAHGPGSVMLCSSLDISTLKRSDSNSNFPQPQKVQVGFRLDETARNQFVVCSLN